MKNVFAFFIIVITIYLLTHIAYATSTPTPAGKLSPTPTIPITPEPTISDSDIRESLQDRLKKAAEEKSDVASQILGANQKRAAVGTLKDLTNNTLTIQLKDGGTKLAALTDKTVFIRKGKTVSQSDLVIGDYTIAMGYINGNNILEARRVVSVETPTERPARKIAIVMVTDVNTKKKSFTATADRPAELGGPETLTITVPKASDLDLSKLEANMKLVIVALTDDKTSSLTLKAYKIW